MRSPDSSFDGGGLPSLEEIGYGSSLPDLESSFGLPSLDEVEEDEPKSILELFPELFLESTSDIPTEQWSSSQRIEDLEKEWEWNLEESEEESLPPIFDEDNFHQDFEEQSSETQDPQNDEELDLESFLESLDGIPESDDDDWTWEDVDEDTEDGFIDSPQQEEVEPLPTQGPFEEPDFETEGDEAPIEPEVPEISKNEPKKKKDSLWSRIKADFGNSSDKDSKDADEENEDEEETEDEKTKKPQKGKAKKNSFLKRFFRLLFVPYRYVAKIVLKILTSILNVFSKIPIIGPLVSKILRASKVLNVISMILPLAAIVYGLFIAALSSAPSSTVINLPDQGKAAFTNFKERDGKVSGLIENKGEVIADVDAIFKVYSYSPNISKPKTWFSMKEVAECPSTPISIDIGDKVEVTAVCPKFDGGLFTRVSGVLVE